jgi:HSP20 family protein
VLFLDVPGVAEKDVSVEVQDSVLRVTGKREALEADAQSTLRERPSGAFQRSFRLPGAVNADAVTARYDRGVLEIHVPKTDNRRKIPIQ